MASLDDKIRNIVEGYISDRDELMPGLSPCILKQMLQELALYVFTESRKGGIVHSLILDVLNQEVKNPEADVRLLAAPEYVRWLCTQYGPGPYCTETAVEVLWRQAKIQILRGGVQQVGRIVRLRNFIV